MVGCTTGSRGEVSGERKPIVRDDVDGGSGDDNNDSNNNLIMKLGQ
jgi:hypothetical protein